MCIKVGSICKNRHNFSSSNTTKYFLILLLSTNSLYTMATSSKMNSTTVLFRDAAPITGNNPTFSRANFSIFPVQQMIQVSTTDIPRIYVTSEYGSNVTQKDLADSFRAGTGSRADLVLFVAPKEIGTPTALAFQERYDGRATEYMLSSYNPTVKGKKRGAPLDCVSVYTPEGYMKMKVSPEVWAEFLTTIPEDRKPSDVLSFPRGDTVFVIAAVTGVWHNATQYGTSLRARRLLWKKAGIAMPGVPQTIEFIDDDDENDDDADN